MTAPRPLPSRLLFVADASHAGGDLPGLALRAVARGVRFVELRHARRPGDPGAPSGTLLADVRAVLRGAGEATVIVNDRVDLALLAGAAGVHVGQDDLPPRAARRLLGEGALVGLSTHDLGQLAEAQQEPVDYVAVGPVFASPTKSGHAEPLGLAGLRAAASRSRLPVVAIGGITARNAADALAAGASAVAVASALAVGDLEENARRLLEAVGG